MTSDGASCASTSAIMRWNAIPGEAQDTVEGRGYDAPPEFGRLSELLRPHLTP